MFSFWFCFEFMTWVYIVLPLSPLPVVYKSRDDWIKEHTVGATVATILAFFARGYALYKLIPMIQFIVQNI